MILRGSLLCTRCSHIPVPLMRALCSQGLSPWHKRSALSPPMYAILTPSHATLACATWQRGFVSPQQGCIRLTLSHGEDAHGRDRISPRAPDQCAHDGG